MDCVVCFQPGTALRRFLALQAQLPGARYAIFVYKDVYIVLVLEAFWTFANSVFPLRSARRTYGFILAAGSIGSSAGARLSRVVGDPVQALWLVLPSLVLALLLAAWIVRRYGAKRAGDESPPRRAAGGT